MRVRTAALLILSLGSLSFPLSVLAQGTARSMDFDTSIRSAAMGGASTAVFFGDEPNSWANPALLGYAGGVRYLHGWSHLIPEITDDIELRSDQLRFGVSGAGLVVSGKPALEGVLLDYGSSQGADEQGNPTGTFDAFEHVESWGFGVSALRLAEGVLRVMGAEPGRWSRMADVSFGMNLKHTRIALAPGVFPEATGNTVDWGVLLRVTPLADVGAARARVEGAIAHAVINADDQLFDFGAGESAPPTRQERTGIAMHVALDPAAGGLGPLGSRPWYLEGLTPLVSVGLSGDWTTISAGGFGPRSDTWATGFEASLLNAITLRTGYVSDPDGALHDPSFGFAFALPVGRVAGVRYEHASFPRPRNSGLSDLKSDSFTFWVDPLEVWALSRRAATE